MSRVKLTLKFHNLEVEIALLRKICEHFTFAGATVDFIGYLVHLDLFAIILCGKAAFVAGAFSVYLLHAEEKRQLQKLETKEQHANAQGQA